MPGPLNIELQCAPRPALSFALMDTSVYCIRQGMAASPLAVSKYLLPGMGNRGPSHLDCG